MSTAWPRGGIEQDGDIDQCTEKQWHLPYASLAKGIAYLNSVNPTALMQSSKQGFHYFLTCRVKQGVLENFFSRIRAICGDSIHPSASEFMSCLRILLIRQNSGLLIKSSSVDMENDGGEVFLSGRISRAIESDGLDTEEHLDILVTEEVDDQVLEE